MSPEPAWCAEARDRIDEINFYVRWAINAERERIRKLAAELDAVSQHPYNAGSYTRFANVL